MAASDPISQLQAFVDERWAVAQPRFYPGAAERPLVHPEVTHEDAKYFLAAVTVSGAEPPLVQVDDERKMRSDRFPPRRDGSPRGYLLLLIARSIAGATGLSPSLGTPSRFVSEALWRTRTGRPLPAAGAW